MKNTLAKNIEVARLKEQCDAACKRLLSQKYILAWIMKTCMAEYKDSAIADIAEKYIEGTPEVGSSPVDGDEPAVIHGATPGATERIQGADTEDSSITEGTVRYDIKYKAAVPSTKETVQLIINIEAQNRYHPGYPLLKRAIYYCGRLISVQKGTEFTGSRYGKLKKVYSVWICIKPPERKQNTITRYSIKEENLVGSIRAKREHYDLLTIVMVNLGSKDGRGLLRLLSTLFASDVDAQEKCRVLESEYNIPMTEKIEEDMAAMCNYSDGVWNDGRTDGLREGRTDGIRIGTVNTTNSLMSLFSKLYAAGRGEEAQRAANDREYLNKLLEEFGQTEVAER